MSTDQQRQQAKEKREVAEGKRQEAEQDRHVSEGQCHVSEETRQTQFLPAWFFLSLIGTDLVRFKALEACIFTEHTARRQHRVFRITKAFVVETASTCLTQISYKTLFKVNNEIMLHSVGFFAHHISPAVQWHLLAAASAVQSHQSRNPPRHRVPRPVPDFSGLFRVTLALFRVPCARRYYVDASMH